MPAADARSTRDRGIPKAHRRQASTRIVRKIVRHPKAPRWLRWGLLAGIRTDSTPPDQSHRLLHTLHSDLPHDVSLTGISEAIDANQTIGQFRAING